MKNLILFGDRFFTNYEFFKEKVDKCIEDMGDDVKILNGSTMSFENIVRRYCAEKEIECVDFVARWNQFGNKAGYIRNSEMLRMTSDVDYAIIFKNKINRGHLSGVRSFIRNLTNTGMDFTVITYNKRIPVNRDETRGNANIAPNFMPF